MRHLKKIFTSLPFVTFFFIVLTYFTSRFLLSVPYAPSEPSLAGAFGFHFLHGNILHFASNAFGFLLAGSFIELYEGRKKYLKILLFILVMISMTTYIFGWLLYSTKIVGASGIVFGVFGYSTMMTLAIMVGRIFRWYNIFLCIFLLFSVSNFLSEVVIYILKMEGKLPTNNIANEVHIYGYILGIVAWFILNSWKNLLPTRKTFEAPRFLKLVFRRKRS